MPGLVGIIVKEQSLVPSGLLDRMIMSLYHEPDYLMNKLVLGKGRCEVANISVNLANAPAHYYRDEFNDVTCIIAGEIYNSSELQEMVRGGNRSIYGFENNIAELVLALYVTFGTDFLRMLNGRFNLIIQIQNKTILANDRFGFMPLYYYAGSDVFLFAPEIKAILQSDMVPRRLRFQSICEYLQFEAIFGDRTYFEDILRLEPASLLTFSESGWSMAKYWAWEEYLSLPVLSKSEFSEKSMDVLERVMRRCLDNSKNSIISLTGGIDTRTIMAAFGPEDSFEKAITFGYRKKLPDNLVAERICRMFNIPHVFINTKDCITEETVGRAVHISDGMTNLFAGLDIASQFREHVKNRIVIKGLFGTEILRPVYKLDPDFDEDSWDEVRNLFNGEIAGSYDPQITKEGIKEKIPNNSLCFAIQEECRHLYYGYFAVQNSLSVIRTPFIDCDLISLLFQCPPDLKIRDIQKDYIKRSNIELANIPTDQGARLSDSSSLWFDILRYKYKTQYFLNRLCNSTKRVPPFLRIDRLPFSFALNRGALIRGDLREYLRSVLLDTKDEAMYLFNLEEISKRFDLHCHHVRDYSRQIARTAALRLYFRTVI